MIDHSKIEWADAAWNPLRGCTKISPGCKRYYAETFPERFRGVGKRRDNKRVDSRGRLRRVGRWLNSFIDERNGPRPECRSFFLGGAASETWVAAEIAPATVLW